MVTSTTKKLAHKKRKNHTSVAPICRAGARLGPNSGPPCCQCHCRSCRACPKKVDLVEDEPPRKRIKCILCERLMFPECLPKHLGEMHSKTIPNRQSQIELHSLKEGEDASFNFDLDQLEGPPPTENPRSRATKFARTNRFLNAANKVSNMQSIFRRMEDMTSEEETRLIDRAVELMNELAKVKKSLAAEREKLLAKTKRQHQEQARNSRASRMTRSYNPETQL